MAEAPRLGSPFHPELLNALATRVRGWSGEAWRLVVQGTDPLTANSRGARWNSAEFEALYFSLDARAANAESDYLLDRQPIPVRKPRELYRFEISLARVLDLCDDAELTECGVPAGSLTADSWDTCQAIAEAAYKYLECAAVLVPSARFPACNLVVFLGGMSAGDELGKPESTPNGPVETT